MDNFNHIFILIYIPYNLIRSECYLLYYMLGSSQARSANSSSSSALQSLTRKLTSTSRPRTLTVGGRQKMSKSSSEPMNLQTDVSPGRGNVVTLVWPWPVVIIVVLSYCVLGFINRLQPQYFLPLHSIRTVGSLTGKISFSWICMRQRGLIFFQWNGIKYSSITMMSYWDFFT